VECLVVVVVICLYGWLIIIGVWGTCGDVGVVVGEGLTC
jgi:hypothetical protein